VRTCRNLALALLLAASGFAWTAVEFNPGLTPAAQAQPLRKLIARLRGQTLPDGIVKAEGRTEAKQTDVSAKYAGQLADISVGEGTKVKAGQVIGRVSSPEIEAQLRRAESDLQAAKDALAGAESEIALKQAALKFAKSDFERGQELMKKGFITKQLFEERKRNYDAAEAALKATTANRDQAQASIEAATADRERIEAMIKDLTLISPVSGLVQYQLARKGETVAASIEA
jgi:HlyD family secretion protein